MNLYLVERTDPVDWNEHDAMVVCARDEAHARSLQPAFVSVLDEDDPIPWRSAHYKPPVDPTSLRVRRIGTAARGMKAGCVLASFIAG